METKSRGRRCDLVAAMAGLYSAVLFTAGTALNYSGSLETKAVILWLCASVSFFVSSILGIASLWAASHERVLEDLPFKSDAF